ncbi:MAG: L-fucose/L-arabinose isomerase family protein [Phycisphaerae bacterium]|nr:L-fucose/L-arabinose isomerase family protein [Phycisphaerae bacterium]
MLTKKVKLGLIPANRGFFSDKLAAKMRGQTIKALEAGGAEVVAPDTSMTKVGCVETLDEAEKVGKMFRQAGVDGIVIGAMNFGDEQGVAYTLRHAGLNVPILVFGCQEEGPLRPKLDRRDSFCGLLSIGDALRQIDVKYTVAQAPICYPTDASFKKDVAWFLGVCRVVQGVRSARYGQVGTRPEAFWTCRMDERQLQRIGVTTVTMDFSEVVTTVSKMKTDAAVKKIVSEMKRGIDTRSIPEKRLVTMAKFELAMERFVEEEKLDGLAIQCWLNVQDTLEISTCAAMGRLGERGIPCACEVDVLGTLTMHSLILAGESPAALADWNNLHHKDPEVVNLWHCGVYPASFACTKPKMGTHAILSTVRSPEVCTGCVAFEVKPGPLTVARVAQCEEGGYKAVVAQGQVVRTNEKTFGAYAWTRLKNLPRLYRDVLMRHFPHHAGISRGHCGNVLWEAWGNYLGFDVFSNVETAMDGRYSTVLPF